MARVLDAQKSRDKLAGMGCEPFRTSTEQFAALIKDDLPNRARIVNYPGASLD